MMTMRNGTSFTPLSATWIWCSLDFCRFFHLVMRTFNSVMSSHILVMRYFGLIWLCSLFMYVAFMMDRGEYTPRLKSELKVLETWTFPRSIPFRSTIIFIIFGDFFHFHQIFFSRQVKSCAIITYKHGIYE